MRSHHRAAFYRILPEEMYTSGLGVELGGGETSPPHDVGATEIITKKSALHRELIRERAAELSHDDNPIISTHSMRNSVLVTIGEHVAAQVIKRPA